jgi:amino acid transporter
MKAYPRKQEKMKQQKTLYLVAGLLVFIAMVSTILLLSQVAPQFSNVLGWVAAIFSIAGIALSMCTQLHFGLAQKKEKS